MRFTVISVHGFGGKFKDEAIEVEADSAINAVVGVCGVPASTLGTKPLSGLQGSAVVVESESVNKYRIKCIPYVPDSDRVAVIVVRIA